MKKVTGKTMTKPGGPYWYWTKLGPANVDLTDREVMLPPGNYDLFWDFRGQAGASLKFSISGPNGELTTVSDSVPAGAVDGWGKKSFAVPV